MSFIDVPTRQKTNPVIPIVVLKTIQSTTLRNLARSNGKLVTSFPVEGEVTHCRVGGSMCCFLYNMSQTKVSRDSVESS
jgi:hypothetical protein